MSLLLCATASVLVMHPSLGNSAVDAFAAIGLLDSKLGVSLLLSILFYCNIFTRKDVMYQNMLVSLPIYALNSCYAYLTFLFASLIFNGD